MARRHAVQLGAWAAHGMWRWRFQSSAVSSQQLLQFPAASLRNLSPRRCQSSPRHGRFQAGTLSRAPAAMDLLNDHHALHFPADLASRAHSHHRCGCSLLPTSQSPPPACHFSGLASRPVERHCRCGASHKLWQCLQLAVPRIVVKDVERVRSVMPMSRAALRVVLATRVPRIASATHHRRCEAVSSSLTRAAL